MRIAMYENSSILSKALQSTLGRHFKKWAAKRCEERKSDCITAEDIIASIVERGYHWLVAQMIFDLVTGVAQELELLKMKCDQIINFGPNVSAQEQIGRVLRVLLESNLKFRLTDAKLCTFHGTNLGELVEFIAQQLARSKRSRRRSK